VCTQLECVRAGVTPLGSGAGCVGGLFMGVVFFVGGLVSPGTALGGSAAVQAAAVAQWPIIPLGEAAAAGRRVLRV
jgi:hypothetical protein